MGRADLRIGTHESFKLDGELVDFLLLLAVLVLLGQLLELVALGRHLALERLDRRFLPLRCRQVKRSALTLREARSRLASHKY